jgi:protein-disulfide isomerase
MKRYLPYLIIGAVAVITAGGGTMLLRAKQRAVPTPTASSSPAVQDAAESRHMRGPAEAPVTLEEFADFQCPPCGNFSPVIKKLEEDYAPRLRVVFHHFPLENHKHARAAAAAAEAAGLQGRFWEMHDLLYQNRPVWSRAPDVRPVFSAYAGIVGLDVPRFLEDSESEAVKARVEADRNYGKSRGVVNTPTIFVNQREVPPPSLNPDGLRAAIDAALNEKPGP